MILIGGALWPWLIKHGQSESASETGSFSNKMILLGAITFDLTFPLWNVPHLLPVTFFWCWTWRKITFWPLCLNSIGTSFRKTSLSQVWLNLSQNFIRFSVKISGFQTLNIFQKIIIPFEYWIKVQIWLASYEIPCWSVKLFHCR